MQCSSEQMRRGGVRLGLAGDGRADRCKFQCALSKSHWVRTHGDDLPQAFEDLPFMSAVE